MPETRLSVLPRMSGCGRTWAIMLGTTSRRKPPVEDGSRDGRGGAGIQERRRGGAGVQEGGDGRGKEDDFMEEQEMSWRR